MIIATRRQPLESGIVINLQNPLESFEMRGGSLRLAIGTVKVDGCRRIEPTPRPIVPRIIPSSSRKFPDLHFKLLQHHTIAAPASRFLITEGPHNTAVIRDRKTNELWTVDPWTHQGSEVPDIFPLAKWKAGE